MLKQRYNYWFIVLFAITVCGTSLYAQPKIVVQDTINWGAVSPDTILDDLEPTVYYSIPIYNKGTEPLIISEVKPSCGCTAAPIDKNVVPPGDSTYMHIGLKLPNQNGELHKLISIFSNDKSDSVKVVNLFAVVERPLQLSSSFIPFNKALLVTLYGDKFSLPFLANHQLHSKSSHPDRTPVCIALPNLPFSRGAQA
ncbi:MAG: hypothetical protein UZ06_CHB003001247 [Chlorobi bacterium OLB6]|nr:MAG: hypothetical protein UZ06_CHB003001247 [Chlorobi bacterium OLB6]